jgi:hypothetical protein
LADVVGGEKIKLIFQPTSYFEYVKTNMAMDFDDAVDGTYAMKYIATENWNYSQKANWRIILVSAGWYFLMMGT